MGGGQTASNSITRYDGIQVQSALLGTCIPWGWGTFKVGCNLLWYGNFKSKAQTSSGKGGGATTGYSYTASLVLGICRGAISEIRNVYKDATIYTPTGGETALAQVGLTGFGGEIGQADWTYLDNNFPSQAIGYSGIAYVAAANYALDDSATPPNHSFEVQSAIRAVVNGTTLDDANPADILNDFLPKVPFWSATWNGDFTNYKNYCFASGLLLSPYMDSQRQASDLLTEIMTASNSNCFFADGVFQVAPYGDTQITGNGVTWTPNLTPIYAFTMDDYIPASEGDDPVTVDIKRAADAYNYVQVEYLDRTNAYRTAIEPASDAANIAQYGQRPNQSPTSLHSICLGQIAATIAQLIVQRSCNVRNTYKWRAGEHFGILNCMDLVTLTTTRMTNQLVRIIEMDDSSGDWEFTAEEVPVGAASSPLLTRQNGQGWIPNTQVDPGSVEANLLLWSEDMTQTAWAKTNATISSNVATDPLFGASTADKLIPTTTSGTHYVDQLFPCFETLNYTYCVYVKPAGYHYGIIELGDGNGNYVNVAFDSTAGTLLTGGQTGNAVLVGNSIASAGNGWFRVSITGAFPTSTTLNAILQVADNGENTSFAGDGTSGLYAWGHQVKQGADLPAYCYTGANYATPLLFDAPPALVNGIQNEIWAAVAGGEYWGGANVWVSSDGTNYEQVGTVTAPSRYGRLVNAVGAGTDPDTTDTFTIDLGQSGGQLTSASQAAANASGSLSILGTELISYSTANLVAQNRYNLTSYTRRGVLGTLNEAHPVNEIFIRLDDAIFQLPYMATTVGETVYVKFQSFNIYGSAVQNISDCIAYTIVPTPPTQAAATAVGVNRVVLSLFEAGASNGWTVSGSVGSQSKSTTTSAGYPILAATGTASASGQTLVIAQATPFPVTAGERLSVQATVGFNANTTAALDLTFYASNGSTVSTTTVASFANPAFPATEEGFVTVPSGAVTASLSLVTTSTGSGSFVAWLAHPMVAGATATQASFPNFLAGPNAEQGATVGAQSGVNLWSSTGAALGDGQVVNAYVPAGGVNRVTLSQFEKGSTGWAVSYDPHSWFNSFSTSTYQGLSLLQLNGTATAAGDGITFEQTYPIPVVGGEWLYINGYTGGGGTAYCQLGIQFFDGNSNNISSAVSGEATGAYPWALPFTTQVPANAVSAKLWCYAQASGAGAFDFILSVPFVCGIQAGQTVFPSFNPGPNAIPGADVTSSNIAAGIAGQGGLATLGSVGTTQINPNSVTAGAASSQGSKGFTSPGTNTLASVSLTTTGNNILAIGVAYVQLTFSASETVTVALAYELGNLMQVQFTTPSSGSGIYAFPFQYGGAMAAGAHTFDITVTLSSSQTSGSALESSVYAVELKR
jgi:hypothetical protein